MSLAQISISQQPGPLRGTWCKRRKESSDEEDANEHSSAKMPRLSWYVTLESESPQPTDEDEESIHSIQGKETDRVVDTSDTSTHTWVSSSDGEVSLHVEYEVASLSGDSDSFVDSLSSSGVDDIVAMGVLAFCDSDLADDSDDSRSSVDSEIGTADYWTCIQCNAKNNNPLFRYCEKCYQIRKNFFPPRPKWRKSRRDLQSAKTNPSELTQIPTQELTSADSGLGSSQELVISQDTQPSSENLTETMTSTNNDVSLLRNSTDQLCDKIVEEFKIRSQNSITNPQSDKLCITCTAAPKNGAFVHGAITHICCCYRCAVKVWRKTKRCPICNRKVTNVLQAFFT